MVCVSCHKPGLKRVFPRISASRANKIVLFSMGPVLQCSVKQPGRKGDIPSPR